VLGCLVASKIQSTFPDGDPFPGCVFTIKPAIYTASLAIITGFDCTAVVIAIMGAVDNPYRHRSDVIGRLRRDGLIFFLILFVLRFITLVYAGVTDPSKCYNLLPVAWSFSAIVNGRLQIQISQVIGREVIPSTEPGDSFLKLQS